MKPGLGPFLTGPGSLEISGKDVLLKNWSKPPIPKINFINA
jgi:hypothetical protein